MLTVDELRALARQAVALGPDGPAVRVEEVLPHLDSEDRNVRVAALRVLPSPTSRRRSTGFCVASTIR